MAETLLIVPAFVPASVPTNWEPRAAHRDVGQVEVADNAGATNAAEQSNVLGCGRDRQVGDGLTLAVEQPGEIRDGRESLAGFEGDFRSQRVGAALVRADGIEIASSVDQHVGCKLRRLPDENAAPAWAGRTEVIRWILILGGLGSAGVVKERNRSSALRKVYVAAGIENDGPLTRSGVVGTQNEITRASARHLAARHE